MGTTYGVDPAGAVDLVFPGVSGDGWGKLAWRRRTQIVQLSHAVRTGSVVGCIPGVTTWNRQRVGGTRSLSRVGREI